MVTSNRGIEFRAGLDISDVLGNFRRIEREAAQTARRVANVGRGAGGAAGRGLGGAGRTVAAGAGLGAGLAVFEQVFEKIFELFEDTPVLTMFTEALDLLFKAFGPVVGVLLKSLTPVIVALTPAIEPLAMALIPLVEIFGTNLLIAVQLLTPLITFAAQGIAFLTTGLQTFINSGINFVIDQLNKLPFVDIQLKIGNTGNSFDEMTAQIAAAGDAAGTGPGTAEGKMRALADGVMAAGVGTNSLSDATEAWRIRQLAAHQETDLFALSLGELTQTTAFSEEANRKAAESTALWTRVAEENAEVAGRVVTVVDLVNDEMDEMYTASTSLGTAVALAVQPVSDLDQRIADMTMQIMDVQTEAALAEDAFAALSPEMQMAAKELGLFGMRVTEVAGAAAAAADDLSSAQGRFDAAQRAARNAGPNQGNSLASGGTGTLRGTFGSQHTRGTGTILTAREVGGVLFFTEHFDPGLSLNAARFGREADVRAFLERQGQNDPQAQHGAYVRGTRQGRRLIVGENYQDEVIRPLREAPGGREMTVVVEIDGETVATATTRAASEGAS